MTTEWENYRAAGEKAFTEKDFATAESNWRKARELAQSFDKYDPRVTTTLEGLAETLWHMGNLEEAEQLCNYVLHLFRVTRGPSHPDYGVVSNNLAMLAHFQGKHEAAEQNYQRALEILGRALGPGHPHVVAISTNYSDLLRLMGREREAEHLKNKALTSADLARSGQFQVAEAPAASASTSPAVEQRAPVQQQQPTPAPQPPTVQPSRPPGQDGTIKVSPQEMQSATGANPVLSPAASVYEKALVSAEQAQYPTGSSPEEKWDNARIHGEAAVAAEDWQKAEFFWQAAVRAAESFPIRDPRLCKSLESLAEVYWKQGKYNLAEPLSRRVLGIYEVVLGTNHPDVGFVANNLGMLYHAQGNLKTAVTLYERSLPLLVSKLGTQHPSIFNLETNLKNVLIALGRNDDANAVKEKLIDAQQKRWTRSGKFEAFHRTAPDDTLATNQA